MSQMKPYCFKCGAELDPEAIYCPDCGRLQRSMVVRAAGSGPGSVPPVPPAPPQDSESYADQPQHPDQSQPYTEQAEPQPGQQAPSDDRGWYPAGGGHQVAEPESEEGRVYAQRPFPQQPYAGQPYPAQEYPEQPYQAPDDVYGAQGDAYAGESHGYLTPEQTHAPEEGIYAPQEPASTEHDYRGQSYPEQGYPQQSYPEQDYAEQSHPEQGYPEQGYPEQSYPGQSYPEQSYPEQSYSPDYPEQRYDYSSRQYPAPDQASTPGGYSGDQDTTYSTLSDPYALEEWQRAPARRQRSWVRLAAIAVAGLTGLFLVGFAIGKVFGGSGGPDTSQAPPQQQSAIVATATPSTQSSATPAATATPDQGTGTANFQKVGADIPGQCSTRQGCPIRVTVKNTGGRGAGTVSVTLTDAQGGGNTVATFSGPIPVTDPGATVQVTGYANGDKLPDYLRAGGTVYISNVTIKNS